MLSSIRQKRSSTALLQRAGDFSHLECGKPEHSLAQLLPVRAHFANRAQRSAPQSTSAPSAHTSDSGFVIRREALRVDAGRDGALPLHPTALASYVRRRRPLHVDVCHGPASVGLHRCAETTSIRVVLSFAGLRSWWSSAAWLPSSPLSSASALEASPVLDRNARKAKAGRVCAAAARLEPATQQQLVLVVACGGKP